MSIKLVDSLSPMGSFPVAEAKDIVFADSENLQQKLDDGSLGGGGAEAYIELSQEEYDALSDEEKVNGQEYRTYDTGHIYKLGVEFGKETDISSKQDNLSQVKFTMRRNSASEGRYCLIGSSDLSQNLLMCEPYRFQGIFGDGTTSVENKSIIDFMVSFREGVENPDEVLSGFANSSKGFDFVDLLITADETTNTAYAYVDFKTSGAVATGEITKPVLEAESYMDFAESFELVDTYQGTLVCKMSDYAKIITNIDDTTASTDTVWSSQKTSDEIDALISDTTSSTTSTYSSSKIDSKLAKYTKTYAGTHSRYIKIGSIPISSGVVTKTTLIMSLFAMSGTSAEYPVGLLNINISSGSGGGAFNINGTTTILLNNTNNLNTPRIVVDKTSTHYNLYVDCVYAYMWIEYMILNQDSNYENGNFEALDALEGATYWSSVTSDDIKYVGDLAKLDDTASSTTSTYSSTKIDEKYGAYTFGTAGATQWLKLTLGNSSKFQPIVISDQYGGKVEITGMADDGTYKSVKLVRYSYGDWTTYSATDYTVYDRVDPNYKIQRLFYYPTNGCYYLEIRQWCTIKVSGATTKPEMVTSLPAEISEMTLIPESAWARKNDIDGTTIQTTTTTSEEYYAITYGDSISTASNQGILIQYKRLNFPPSTYIFSATSYTTNARETVSVAKISNNYAGTTYDLKFYIDKDNKTVYLRMPSYSGVSLQNLAFKSKAVTYTKVDSIPSTATTLAVTEYASINDSSTGDTTSTWSSSKIASTINNKLLVGTAEPTTDTLPVGAWYGRYE